MNFHLYLPQMRMPLPVMVERARAAEAAGFEGIGLMDHLAPPMALDQPMWEAMVTAAWLIAHTERLVVGHLVLCDAFRHPAVLAREAVTLDHASGGRFELGLGWGSVAAEFDTFGVAPTEPRHKVGRMAETLQVLEALWSGRPVDFDGVYHQLRQAAQQPTPLGHIPVVIGGVGPKTLELVAAHADWWNLPVHRLSKLDELRPRAGRARVSVQQMVGFIPSEDRRAELNEVIGRRFGRMGGGLVIGSAPELVEHFAGLADRGIERVYAWFTDFAAPETLARFGAEVIAALG